MKRVAILDVSLGHHSGSWTHDRHKNWVKGIVDRITTATFDCYGTLIDWEGGLGCFLYDLALQNGETDPPNGRALRERWETIQFELISGPYQTYKAILAQSLKIFCDERGYTWNDQFGVDLVRSMRSWQPFHETEPALERVRAAGLRLVIISNTDRDIIAHLSAISRFRLTMSSPPKIAAPTNRR